MEQYKQVRHKKISKRLDDFITYESNRYIPGYIESTLNLLSKGVDDYVSENTYDEIFGKIHSIDCDDDGYLIINENQKMKFGKLIFKVGKCLSGKSFKIENVSNTIERFVDSYKSWYKINNSLKFKYLEGEDIIYKGYNKSLYTKSEHGSLHSSCMNDCKNYLELYSKNKDKVKLLILVDDMDNIFGRALVWKLDNRPFSFMDRVYGANNYIINMFKDYSIKNKLAYRSSQMGSFDIYLPNSKKSKKSKNYKLKVKLNVNGLYHFPYMDSLRYWDEWGNSFSNLTDTFSKYRSLDSTSGCGKYLNPSIKLFGITIY